MRRILTSNWHSISLKFVISVVIFAYFIKAREVKVFKRGKIELVDETQFDANSKDQIDFKQDPDLQKQPDFENVYDELVPYLPRFTVFKNGKNIGFSRLNISTRRQPTWSTPQPRTRKGDYRTWGTPKLEPITKTPPRGSQIKLPKIQKQKLLSSDHVVETTTTAVKITSTTPKELVKERTFSFTSRSLKRLKTTTSEANSDEEIAADVDIFEMKSTRDQQSLKTKLMTTANTPSSRTTLGIKRKGTLEKANRTPATKIEKENRFSTTSGFEITTSSAKSTKVMITKKPPSVFTKVTLSGDSFSKTPTVTRQKIRPSIIETRFSSRIITGTETPEQIRRFIVSADHEQRVKSNRFTLQQKESEKTTSVSIIASSKANIGVGKADEDSTLRIEAILKSLGQPEPSRANDGRFSWSRSWNLSADRRRLIVHTWDSERGSRTQVLPLLPDVKTSNDSALKTPKSERKGPTLVESSSSGHEKKIKVKAGSSDGSNLGHINNKSLKQDRGLRFETESESKIESVENLKSPKTSVKFVENRTKNALLNMKPPVIQEPHLPYRGPTYNCKILNSVEDGTPTIYNDRECKLSSPGFSLDGSCKCTFEVNGRDEHGCATGFLYTCTPHR